MQLVTYSWCREPRFGVLAGDRIIDIDRASTYFSSTRSDIRPIGARIEDFFDKIDVLSPSLKAVVDLYGKAEGIQHELSVARSDVDLLPPIPRPPKILCVARNYAEHAKEAGLEISPIPILFARFSATLVGDRAPVIIPTVSHQVDWEGELAIIIGRATNGQRIAKAEAMEYVYGYSVFNDVTVRDYQFRVSQYTGGKNFRASGPFGPAIVTKDEVADPHNLQITTTINGTVMQSAKTSDMLYDIPTIIEHISDFIDLEPGDVIPTGTPAGVGFKRNPPIFLKHGDTITVDIPSVGALINPVVDEGK